MEKINLFVKRNWILLFAIAYLIIPTDIIPDIIPVLGKLDDTGVLFIELLRRVGEFKNVQK